MRKEVRFIHVFQNSRTTKAVPAEEAVSLRTYVMRVVDLHTSAAPVAVIREVWEVPAEEDYRNAFLEMRRALTDGITYGDGNPDYEKVYAAAALAVSVGKGVQERLLGSERYDVPVEAHSELVIYAVGLVHMSVCTKLTTPQAIESRANQMHPAGGDLRWKIAACTTFRDGTPMPCPCRGNPNTHKHWLLNC